MVMHNLHDVMMDTIKDIYHAEKQLVKALPRLAKAATSDELRDAIEDHLDVTERQVERLERVFKELDTTPKGKVCRGMMGLVDEGKEVLEHQRQSNPAAVDAALIAAAQKVEHYEIAAYGSARTFAETLGLDTVAELLQESLEEEEEADRTLTALAVESINEAATDNEQEEETERRQPAVSGSKASSRKR